MVLTVTNYGNVKTPCEQCSVKSIKKVAKLGQLSTTANLANNKFRFSYYTAFFFDQSQSHAERCDCNNFFCAISRDRSVKSYR